MKPINHLLLLLLCIAFATQAIGQEKTLSNLPLKISLLDESITLPNLKFLNGEYNPALMVGTEFLLKQKKNHDFHLTANLGFYHHKDWQTALFLNSEIGYRYHLNRWNVSARLGAGYAHTFANKPIYAFENGEWQKAKNSGHPTFMPSLALVLGYRFSDAANSPEIFLTYMGTINLPLRIFTSTHQLIGLGIKTYPFK